MEAFIQAVCDDFKREIVDSFEADDLETMAEYVSRAISKHKGKLPNTQAKTNLKFKNSIGITKTPTISPHNLCWTEWKKDRPTKMADLEDPSIKISLHAYWKKYVWNAISPEDKAKWQSKADNMRTKNGKATGEKKKVSTSGYHLFLKKMKTKMNAKESFIHPSNGKKITTHTYLLYVWSNYVKTSEYLKYHFEEMAANLKTGVIEFADRSNPTEEELSPLPYLDLDQLRSQDFENLELVMES